MEPSLVVLAYASLPVIGHALGVFFAELLKPSSPIVGSALHSSAGIAFALVAFEFLPRITTHVPFLLMLLMFGIGVLLSIALAKIVHSTRKLELVGNPTALMVYCAIIIDLLADGFLTGAGSAIDMNLGFLLSAAQSLANIPGGFAASATLREYSYSQKFRITVGILVALPVFLSAILSLWLVSGRSLLTQNSILMIMGGILLLTTVEDIIPEGDAPRPARWYSSIAFGLGFIGLAAFSHYL